MTLWAVLPVKPLSRGKSRLHGCMKAEEICAFNRCLFEDTFRKLNNCINIDRVLVVSQDEAVLETTRQMGGYALKEERQSSLNAAVSQALEFIMENDPGKVLIIPTDLPWMTAQDLAELLKLRREGEFIAIVPDERQWGTNAILISHPGLLKPQYGRRSFQKHVLQAANRAVELIVWLNKNIQKDLDTPQDLLIYNKIKINPIHILTE